MRRSKSQLHRPVVTAIRHGGSVTLVSLGGDASASSGFSDLAESPTSADADADLDGALYQVRPALSSTLKST